MPSFDDISSLREALEADRNRKISKAVQIAKDKVITYIKKRKITKEEGVVGLKMYKIYFREGHEESIEQILVNNRKRNTI